MKVEVQDQTKNTWACTVYGISAAQSFVGRLPYSYGCLFTVMTFSS